MAYIPPPRVGNPQYFLDHLLENPSRNPLILFSEYKWPLTVRCPDPATAGEKVHVAAFTFLWALKIAIQRGYTDFLFLEEDCRVAKPWWDVPIFEEYSQFKEGVVAAGSVVVYNPDAAKEEERSRCLELSKANDPLRKWTYPTWFLKTEKYGLKGRHCLFIMGACGIYQVEALKELFGRINVQEFASGIECPWDVKIGKLAWEKHGVKSYDKIRQLKTVYSGYGDFVTNLVERRAMLEGMEKMAVHQVKQKWKPSLKPVILDVPNHHLTTVITSHLRPEKLLAAFRSCINCGQRNIVVAATDGAEMVQVLARIKKENPATKVILNREGCANKSWLEGVEAAETSHVNILHDDDKLRPNYLNEVLPLLPGSDLIYTPGLTHDTRPNMIRQGNWGHGCSSTVDLMDYLMDRDALSISPVAGIFRKEDLVAALRRCERDMGREFELRPGFLIGNDLMIWLMAAGKYPSFCSVAAPVISYGCGWESTTGQHGKELLKYYNLTRDLWVNTSTCRSTTLNVV